MEKKKMTVKKKVLISVLLIVLATVGAFCFGYFTTHHQPDLLEMQNPTTITYYVNEERTEGFELTMPKDVCDKTITSIDEPVENVKSYTFRHKASGEILFIVYASKGDAYKGLDVKNTVIGENGEYVYVWTQSVEENENITDENAKNEYKEIAKYFETIKDSVKIVCVQ